MDKQPSRGVMLDLWGQPVVRSGSYFVFHDESIPNKRWFLTGLSFVKEPHIEEVREALHGTRENESYFGEIHFSALPKSFDGEYGGKARVARAWMEMFEKGLSEILHFSCLAVDRHSPAYDHRRFTHEFHAYNRFTAMALKSGIAWHIGPEDLDRVTIQFVSDAKYRVSRPDQGMIDNFEKYLPYRAQLDSFLQTLEGKKYPDVHLSSPKLQDSSEDDLLQFTDLLLGSAQMALVAASNRPVKRRLGEYIVRWHRDLLNPPWEQQFHLHRRFSLWAFPDKDGRPYSNIPLKLCVSNCQISLFNQEEIP